MPLTLIYNLPNNGITISIPLIGTNISIDWGDTGSVDPINLYKFTYDTLGEKTINITGGVTQLLYGSILSNLNKQYLISCTDFGIGLERILFSGAISLTSVPDILPTTVTDMSFMFYNATSFNANVSNWDVSNVTDMHHMFYNATSFNANVSSWNVSNVTNMSYMFENATSFNSSVNWQHMPNSNCSMLRMFENAITFDQDVSSWDVSKITTMEYAFKNTNVSIENYNKCLNIWGNLDNLEPCIFTNNLLVYTAESSTGRQQLINKGWNIQDDILLNTYPIYVNEPFLLQYNRDSWPSYLYGGSIKIFYKTTLLETILIDPTTKNLILNPITVSDTGKIQLTIKILINGQVVATEYVNLYVNTRAPIIKPIIKTRMSMGSLFTDNAMVYYKPHSLAAGGIGGVRNYRKKSKKT